VFTELDALADKTAPTIATSIEGVVREVAGLVGDAIPEAVWSRAGGALRQYILAHVLVGDDISTNDKAYRCLWAAAVERPFHKNLIYLLFAGPCANHQANRTTGSVAEGKIAQVAAGNTAAAASGGDATRTTREVAAGDNATHAKACGMVTRYNKFLVNDYYSHFKANLVQWAKGLRVIPPRAAPDERRPAPDERRPAPGAASMPAQLQQSYGKATLPDALIEVLNVSLGSLEHEVPENCRAAYEADPDAYKAALVEKLLQCLTPHLLNISESPTHSRMFTFNIHMCALTCLVFLAGTGLPEALLQVHTTVPRKDNAKRLRIVKRWLRQPDTAQYLRRTVLSMRGTEVLHAMSARTVDRGSGKPPMVVRFAQGAARQAVDAEVKAVVALFPLDPDLDQGAAFTAVTLTALDLLDRFARYEMWPYKGLLLCKTFNPHFHRACGDLLAEVAGKLDVGFGLALRDEAAKRGDDNAALNWLQSPGVQGVLEETGYSASATNLPGEREVATLKKRERSKLSHLAGVGGKRIQRAVGRRRREKG